MHEKRPDTAFDIIDQFVTKCDLLARNPLLGTARSELGEGYRVFSHKRWVIIFRPIHDGIEVMRIVDGARDYDRLF